jgi:hypothetical protein
MRNTTITIAAAACLPLLGCGGFEPIGQPTPSAGTEVAASFSATWDAVIDVFAERNIPIKTLDRQSGFIVAEDARVVIPPTPVQSPMRRSGNPTPVPEGQDWADCGAFMGTKWQPNRVIYNILVRGDSTRAMVRANATWWHDRTSEFSEQCATRGVWEAGLEKSVRARATKSGGG